MGRYGANQPLVRVLSKVAVRSQASLGGHWQRPCSKTQTAGVASGLMLCPEAELGVGGKRLFLQLSRCYVVPLTLTPVPVQLLPGMAGD